LWTGFEPACGGQDEGLRYTLRSFDKYGLTLRLRTVHILCRTDGEHRPPAFLKPASAFQGTGKSPKLVVTPFAKLEAPGQLPVDSVQAALAVLHRLDDAVEGGLADWFVVLPAVSGPWHVPVLKRQFSERSYFTTKLLAPLDVGPPL
jgi:hypothetical protein